MVNSNIFDKHLDSKPFLLLVKQNREKLKRESTCVNITPEVAATCENNFFRLLRELGYSNSRYHQTALVLNGFDTPREYSGNRDVVFLPSPTPVERMLSLFKTTYPENRL